MTISKEAFDLSVNILKEHEGLRLKPYKCTAGKLTIGYGRNLEDRGITEPEAFFLLTSDIHDISRELEIRIPFFNNLNDTRKAVLVDMAYNLGINGLLQFKNMLIAISHNDYVTASVAMLQSKWADQVGKRSVELSKLLVSGKVNDESF
jgi:lysozyme